jgi:tetratricopeptide (TPR) repeat protein
MLLAITAQAAPEADAAQVSPQHSSLPSAPAGVPPIPEPPILDEIARGDFKSQAGQDREKRALSAAAYSLGQQAESEGLLDKALALYQGAAEADPDYLPTAARMAYILLRQERNEEARDLLTARLASSPDNASLHSLLAFTYLQENDMISAEREATTSMKLDPVLASNYRVLTQIYRDAQRRDDIEALRIESLKIKSDKAETYSHLGDMWATLLVEGSTEVLAARLLPFYSKALELDPGNPLLSFKAGNLELELGHFETAVTLLQKACDANDQLPQVRERLSLALLGNRQEKEAADVLEKLVIEQPERSSLYPLLGELYERAGKLDKAEENYRMTVNLGHGNAEDYINLARVQILAGHPDEAIKTLALAETGYPALPHIPLLQAYAYRAQKKYKDALNAFRRAELLAGKDLKFLSADFYIQYASVCEQAGMNDKAEELLQQVLTKDPSCHDAMNYLGYMWAEQGRNLPEAEKLIGKALSFEPENPAYLDSLGWVYFQQGRYEEASQLLTKALKGMPEDSVVNDHLGDAFFKIGRIADAVEHWEKALPKASNADSIRAKIQSSRSKVAER